MRVEWELDGFDLALADFPLQFAPIAERTGMRWRLESDAPAARAWRFSSRTTITAWRICSIATKAASCAATSR